MSSTFTVTISSTPHAITLPSPELFDSRTVRLGGKFRRSRDNSLYGYKTAVLEQLDLSYAHMNRPDIESFRAWLELAVGNEVTIVLDSGDTWVGHILNDPMDFVHESVRNNTFTVSLEGVQS